MAMAEPDCAAIDVEARYAQRLSRYVTAMRNEKPDAIPIRPFVAEFTGTYAGYTCQELAHDFTKAFDAACKCTCRLRLGCSRGEYGLCLDRIDPGHRLRYYGVPGIHVPANMGFQYLEPPEDDAFMGPDEYDQLIEDPTGFLYHVWLPRVAKPVGCFGAPVTEEHNLSFLKGGMAMMLYFLSFPATGSTIARANRAPCRLSAGIFKAPMDILADKLRGYVGLVDDSDDPAAKVRLPAKPSCHTCAHVAPRLQTPTSTCPSVTGCTAAACPS